MRHLISATAALLATGLATLPAAAQEASDRVIGKPEAWATGYQPAVTEVAARLHDLTFWLHVIATLITVFVTVLLAYTVWRYAEKRNPTPDRFSHNTPIEVAWTLVPVLILVGIAWPSIKYLYFQQTVPPANVTVKAIGHQWYWEYMYVIDGEEVYVDSNMAGYGYATYDDMVNGMLANGASEDEIPSRALWRLESTQPMIVPSEAIVNVQVTSVDVLHAFAMPSFGVKADAVPGQLNETWFAVGKAYEGTYYGQCSELCGKDHAYMPIEVKVVSPEAFEVAMQEIKAEYAAKQGRGETRVATLAADQ